MYFVLTKRSCWTAFQNFPSLSLPIKNIVACIPILNHSNSHKITHKFLYNSPKLTVPSLIVSILKKTGLEHLSNWPIGYYTLFICWMESVASFHLLIWRVSSSKLMKTGCSVLICPCQGFEVPCGSIALANDHNALHRDAVRSILNNCVPLVNLLGGKTWSSVTGYINCVKHRLTTHLMGDGSKENKYWCYRELT